MIGRLTNTPRHVQDIVINRRLSSAWL